MVKSKDKQLAVVLAAHAYRQQETKNSHGIYGHRDWGELARRRSKLDDALRAWLHESDRNRITHYERYEFLRTLNPREFAELWNENLTTGKPFDTLVDELIAARHWEK